MQGEGAFMSGLGLALRPECCGLGLEDRDLGLGLVGLAWWHRQC